MTHNFHRLYSVALSALLIGGLTAPLALAQNAPSTTPSSKPAMTGHKHHKMDGQRKAAHEQFMKDLNLTEQQKQQFKAAHEKFHQDNAAAFASMKAKHEQLKQLGNDPANEAQRQQLRSELRQERQALMAKKQDYTKGILTPEQQAKWDAKKAERKANHEKFHKNHAQGQTSQ